MLELKSINYSVIDKDSGKNRDILKDVSVSFPKNKITVITGHNGSGKSTLVKLIMGLIKPTSGEILFDGKNITDLAQNVRANMGFTMAFQQPVRFKGLTVKDVLNLANKMQNNISQACEFLSQVGLCAKDYIDRELDDSLSGGELKRIELAISLCKGGDVLLFDEPEAGIDLWSFDELVNIFKNLKNKTVIIVSHQKKILEIADYILLLSPQAEEFKFGKKEDLIKFLNAPVCRNLGGVINE